MALPDNATWGYRLGQLEHKVEVLDVNKADADDVKELSWEIRRMRRTFTSLLVTIAGASVIGAITVLETALRGG